ncbi:DUF4440 domain-containing protein [Enemella evansiae]|uniref:nuclear transport factor 2 family protein n=1 Tax=Enemella evansiae TaxID=2016499 RepID=UPI000B97177C|nr:nuclear transport factor 2 family protein [Enemella evansiae]OYO15512.1 DUF4440 domain-containing protein [Enemella evansiae]
MTTAPDTTLDTATRLAIGDFYARQMEHLSGLRIEEYANTFTDDAVVEHVPGGTTQGRAALVADAERKLPAYRGVKIRHWSANHVFEVGERGTVAVRYATLVTKCLSDGSVVCSTFSVVDHLVFDQGQWRTSRRRIVADPHAEVEVAS